MPESPRAGPPPHLPTSDVLLELVGRMPADAVTLDWVLDHLRDRSFGVVMLLLALLGLLPGISVVAAILLALPAIQMMQARPRPVLPRFLAARRIPARRFAAAVKRLAPVLRRLERLVRPRWATPFEATKRVVGLAILLLCATLLAPLPFSNIIPAAVIMLLAVAFLEEDGVLLCVALAAAVGSIALTAAAVWGTVEAGLLL